MALSLSLPFTRWGRRASEHSMSEPTTTADRETPVVPDDPALRLDNLYTHAGDLEVELEGVARRNAATLSAGQIGAFNQILREARDLIPNSKALREDVDEIDATVRPADAYHALHVTIVPTLHNALPEALYRRR